MRFALLGLAALVGLSAPVAAQSLTPGRNQDNGSIVVTGTRPQGSKPVPMSDWRVAETSHVQVFSKGDEKRLTQIAHNLEKLHFLLSVLLNQIDQPDDTIKLSVTLFGDYADFNHLNLDNVRWQQGPFPKAFPSERYYDPREDGAVLATTQIDQKIVLQQGRPLSSIGGMVPDPDMPGQMKQSLGNETGAVADATVNESSFPLTAEGRLYAGYAQHYLLTYFPAAYPRWYLDGFGEIFATLSAEQDGVIEYGHRPEGFREVTEHYGRYPVRGLVAQKYLVEKPSRTSWTPYQAWALVHLLFFSDEWKAPLNRYLAAVAKGAAPEEAGKALGDLDKLQRELASYRGSKVPFERMTYPADRAPPPILRQLTRSEAGFVRGRLELGARVETPPGPRAGADAEAAAQAAQAQRSATAKRAVWLGRLRQEATRFPGELESQLLLAEGECRTGGTAACLAAADRALALSPKNASALAWKGIALAQAAIAGPASERTQGLRAARAIIARANRADTEAVLPLLAYYRSFADAGEKVPVVAVDGVQKALDSVPSAPASRLMLGSGLAEHGQREAARKTLLPIAKGAYQSPEQQKAEAILESMPN